MRIAWFLRSDKGDYALDTDSREINDKDGISLSQSALGTVLDAQGDFLPAKKMLEVSIDLDLQNRENAGPSPDKLLDLADILQHMGDLPSIDDVHSTWLILSPDP